MRVGVSEKIFLPEVSEITEGMLALLHQNRENHPEFKMRLTSAEREAIPKIESALLELPLLHRSTTNIPRNKPMLSSRQVGKISGTAALDQSLGLDQFIYFSWAPTTHLNSRAQNYLVDSRILLSTSAVVTQSDITTQSQWEMWAPYNKLSKEKQRNIRRSYFGRMLTGTDWVELTARRVLQSLKKGQNLCDVSGGGLGLGEVKILGKVSHKDVLLKSQSEKELAPALINWYEHGFSVNGEIPRKVGDLKVNVGRANKYWRSVVGADLF